PRDRGSRYVLPGIRRRPDGGRLARGLLARRPPQARPADRDLRRQSHHHRREDRSYVLGRHRQAVRELRLARGSRGGRQRSRRAGERGAGLEAEWQAKYDAYHRAHAELAAELERRLAGRLPDAWDDGLPEFTPKEAQATRAASGKSLNALAAKLPELLGGSADLAASTNVVFKNGGDVAAGSGGARNVHFGIREHAMGAILNGLALHGGVRPVGSTFLIFSDYMRPPIR